MSQIIFQKLNELSPTVGIYSLLFFGIIYVTYKTTVYSLKVRGVVNDFPDIKKLAIEVEKIPRMERMLEKIDRGLSALNSTLLEKKVINQSYHNSL